MSVKDIDAAKRRLLFTCALCEEHGTPAAAAQRHTGVAALRQHYRTIHPGEPVRSGSVQEEPPFLWHCSACSRVFGSERSYKVHKTTNQTLSCSEGEGYKLVNEHQNGPRYAIEMPRPIAVASIKRTAENITPAPPARRLMAQQPTTPTNDDLDGSDAPLTTAVLLEQLAVSATQPNKKSRSSSSASATADSDEHLDALGVPLDAPAAVPQKQTAAIITCVERNEAAAPLPPPPLRQTPTSRAEPKPVVKETDDDAALTLENAVRSVVSDPTEVARRLAVYSGLGIHTLTQARALRASMPRGFRYYLIENGAHAKDISYLFHMLSDIDCAN